TCPPHRSSLLPTCTPGSPPRADAAGPHWNEGVPAMSEYTPKVTGTGAKAAVQRFGGFLAGMIMPNIGAFIAWGLITAIFIEVGWWPVAQLGGFDGRSEERRVGKEWRARGAAERQIMNE